MPRVTAGWAILLLLFVSGAAATGGGQVVLYGGAGHGKVIFDGRTHASAGLVCNDCHTAPALFPMRKQALITRPAHSESKACFACHNGQRAFLTCEQCHRTF
jgi:thiosulfate reductase cytochrome b subunit